MNNSKNSYSLLRTNRRGLLLGLAAALALVTVIHTPALAQDKTSAQDNTSAQDKTAEIDKIFSFAKPDVPGCTVAVSQNGKPIMNRAYGAADLERNVPVSPNSIFDIGSVRKQFVAAAVLPPG